MSDLPGIVLSALRGRARSGPGRLRLGVFCRGNQRLVEALLAEPWIHVVMGDRFGPLLAAHRRATAAARPAIVVEMRLDAIPARPRSLDAVVLARGLPTRIGTRECLEAFGRLLAPGGMLVWPHPVVDGAGGRIGRILVPVRPGTARPLRRHAICAEMMAAGFGDVRQTLGRQGPAPWAVTTGRMGPRPWDPDPEQIFIRRTI